MFGTKRIARRMLNGVNIVKLTLYKVLVDDLSKKYQKEGEEFYKTLAAIIVNEIFTNHDSESQAFFAKNEKVVIAEIKNLGANHPELKRAMTDSLRVFVTSNTMLKHGLKIFLKRFLRKDCDINIDLFNKAIDRGIFIGGGESPHLQSFLDMTNELGRKYGVIKEGDSCIK